MNFLGASVLALDKYNYVTGWKILSTWCKKTDVISHDVLNMIEEYVDNIAENFAATKTIHLDIKNDSDMKISHLPIAWKEFSNIEDLNFEGFADFQEFPDYFGTSFIHLTTIDIYGSSIKILPKSFDNLINLEILCVRSSKIHSIECSLNSLTKLTRISFNNNNIEKLPGEWKNLTKLKYLFLDNNSIEILPPDIGNLQHLAILSLDNNKIKCLPDSLTNLTSLSSLYLSHNNLEEFPVTLLNSIRSLSRVDLSLNKIRYLPPGYENVSCQIVLNGNPCF